MIEFLGIARERVYSPDKIDADRAILDAVAERLAVCHRVEVVSADDPLPQVSPANTVFAMCQGPLALRKLQRWERAGVRVINSPAAIENCQRRQTLAAFEKCQIAQPPSVLVDSDQPMSLPPWVEEGAWLKRADVHATEPGDVVLVRERAAACATLAQFRRRGIGAALVQRNVDGDVIKFYAVHGLFFAGFPEAGVNLDLGRREQTALTALAEQGATALGLEVFGGDCVRDGRGRIWLIDLNDWPSYAPCRTVAAEAISTYLRRRAS